MEDEEFEADLHSILVPKVVLPFEKIKRNVIFTKEYLIGDEKRRILREAKIPEPELYEVAVHGPHGSIEILDDEHVVADVITSLQGGAECQVHIQIKGSQVERQARPVQPDLLNINMK